MHTSRTLRARFVRKPADLAHVLDHTRTEGCYSEATAVIDVVQAMTGAEYDAFVADFFASHHWLNGHGGRDRQGRWRVIEVTAPGRRTLYIDPEGYDYARYVGLVGRRGSRRKGGRPEQGERAARR